jgi:integrase
MFALFAIALLVLTTLGIEALLVKGEQAIRLLRRGVSRRRGRCELGLMSAIHTGLRRSELLSLRWNNINFDHRLVTVEAAYSKSGEARSVPMSLRLTETLRQIKIANPSSLVFLDSEGKPYRNVTTAFDSAAKRAGIQDFTFHNLRHTFASRLVMGGVDLTTMRELMGHKHIKMTLRYAHLSPGHKPAIAVLDQSAPIFASPSETAVTLSS